MRIGGQEHFYLETQTSLVVPKGEDGEMELFCSSQNPSEAQVNQHQIYQPVSTMAFNLPTLVKGQDFDAANFADFSEWSYISLMN